MNDEPKAAPLPWASEDFVRWCARMVGGVIVWIGGWWLASGEALISKQLSGAFIAIGGIVLALSGDLLWILRGRYAVGKRRLALVPDVDVLLPVPHQIGSDDDCAAFVAGTETRLFHQAQCAFAEGRCFDAATRAEHAAAGRTPCGVCLPDAQATPELAQL